MNSQGNTGNVLINCNQNQVQVSTDTLRMAGDESFFHITCHIDVTLKGKIEKGEFAELEKLLPKDIMKCQSRDESRMELVHNDGSTYFVPATDRDRRFPVLDTGNKLLGCMLQYTLEPIHRDLLKSGSMFISLI